MEAKISVSIRVVSSADKENINKANELVKVDGNTLLLKTPSSQVSPDHAYVFDNVFLPGLRNSELFDLVVTPLVDKCFAGFNGTLLLYGDVGGDSLDFNLLLTSAVEKLLGKIIASARQKDYSLKLSVLEITPHGLEDPLSRIYFPLEIHETPHGVVFTKGLTHRTISVLEDVDLLHRPHSSHLVISLHLDKVTGGPFGQRGTFTMAILATPESPPNPAVSCSLTALSKVVLGINTGASHLPFRESRLTRVLQPALGGNCFTSLLCMIEPQFFHTSITTLDFASRCRKVSNKPEINYFQVNTGDTTIAARLEAALELIRRLSAELALLKRELAKLRKPIDKQSGSSPREKNYEKETMTAVERREMRKVADKQISFLNDAAEERERVLREQISRLKTEIECLNRTSVGQAAKLKEDAAKVLESELNALKIREASLDAVLSSTSTTNSSKAIASVLSSFLPRQPPSPPQQPAVEQLAAQAKRFEALIEEERKAHTSLVTRQENNWASEKKEISLELLRLSRALEKEQAEKQNLQEQISRLKKTLADIQSGKLGKFILKGGVRTFSLTN